MVAENNTFASDRLPFRIDTKPSRKAESVLKNFEKNFETSLSACFVKPA